MPHSPPAPKTKTRLSVSIVSSECSVVSDRMANAIRSTDCCCVSIPYLEIGWWRVRRDRNRRGVRTGNVACRVSAPVFRRVPRDLRMWHARVWTGQGRDRATTGQAKGCCRSRGCCSQAFFSTGQAISYICVGITHWCVEGAGVVCVGKMACPPCVLCSTDAGGAAQALWRGAQPKSLSSSGPDCPLPPPRMCQAAASARLAGQTETDEQRDERLSDP